MKNLKLQNLFINVNRIIFPNFEVIKKEKILAVWFQSNMMNNCIGAELNETISEISYRLTLYFSNTPNENIIRQLTVSFFNANKRALYGVNKLLQFDAIHEKINHV